MTRHYTLNEANDILPELTSLLNELRARARQLSMVQARRADVTKKIKGNGYHNPGEDNVVEGVSRTLQDGLRESLEKLAELEIELKDIASGLVDFPALRDGRTVFLCWKLGEPEIGFWHELDSGFAGRKPVDSAFS